MKGVVMEKFKNILVIIALFAIIIQAWLYVNLTLLEVLGQNKKQQKVAQNKREQRGKNEYKRLNE